MRLVQFWKKMNWNFVSCVWRYQHLPTLIQFFCNLTKLLVECDCLTLFFFPCCCSKVEQIECTTPIALEARTIEWVCILEPRFRSTVLKRLFKCFISAGILHPTRSLVLTNRSHLSWHAWRSLNIYWFCNSRIIASFA